MTVETSLFFNVNLYSDITELFPNMPSLKPSIYLINTRTICAIFLYNWTQCVDESSL